MELKGSRLRLSSEVRAFSSDLLCFIRGVFDMNVDEIRAILDKWQATMIESDTRLDALMSMMMAAPESDFFMAQYAMMGAYTEAIARLVNDYSDWLSWWWLDCAFGAAGHRDVKPWGSAEWRHIENTNDLAQLLFDCDAHEKT